MTLQEIRAAIAALDERRSELDAKIAERRSGGDAGDVLGVFVADADGEPTEYAAHAEKIGLFEIGFSDHSPMPDDDFDDWRMKLGEFPDYLAKVEQARRDNDVSGPKGNLEAFLHLRRAALQV